MLGGRCRGLFVGSGISIGALRGAARGCVPCSARFRHDGVQASPGGAACFGQLPNFFDLRRLRLRAVDGAAGRCPIRADLPPRAAAYWRARKKCLPVDVARRCRRAGGAQLETALEQQLRVRHAAVAHPDLGHELLGGDVFDGLRGGSLLVGIRRRTRSPSISPAITPAICS